MPDPTDNAGDIVDYDALAGAFNQALLHTLRKHSVADAFLDYWVPDADPVLGVLNMIDSARIAGRSSVAIRFAQGTIPAGRMPELERGANRLGTARIDRYSDHYVLRATDMTGDELQDKSPASQTEKATYWSADQSTSVSSKPARSLWDSVELPAFADAHPALRATMDTASRRLEREGERPSPDATVIRVMGERDGRRLVLDVDPDKHVVKSARHIGGVSLAERVALDRFCLMAEAVPLQEVADHIGLKVIDSFVDEDKAPPVRGVLLPANAGAPFRIGPALARDAYNRYRETAKVAASANNYAPVPSDDWRHMDGGDRKSRIEGGLRGFLQSEQLYPDDLTLLRLENNRTGYDLRAIVAFSERIAIADKPSILRRLERRLRRDIERQIEVVADRAKDTSPLRRLT